MVKKGKRRRPKKSKDSKSGPTTSPPSTPKETDPPQMPPPEPESESQPEPQSEPQPEPQPQPKPEPPQPPQQPPAPVEPTPDSEQIDQLAELSSKTTVIDAPEPDPITYPSGPEPEGWKPKPGSVPKKPITKVHALGDLHGWAPGLITYLTHHQLAKIEINGRATYKSKKGKLSIDAKAMKELFPHPLEYKNKNSFFSGAGLLGLDLDDGEGPWKHGHFDIKAEWIGNKTDPNACFVQIGDVFDRSDYNELGAEILRQLIIQAPMRVFVLVGNHEQFMLEGDYENWFYNESRWAFDSDKHRNGDLGFHTRFHPQTYGWTARQAEDTGPRQVFRQYQAATAVLYLTQACALRNALGKTVDGVDSKIILEGGFSAYQYAFAWLKDKLRSATITSPNKLPGAYTALGLGHTLFVHAEVAGFSEKNTVDSLEFFIAPPNRKDPLFVASLYRQVNAGINSSPDFPLLWERNSSHGASSNPPSPACAEYIQNLVEKLPGIRHYVHGHTPVPGVSWFNDQPSGVVSYVARDSTKAPSRSKSSVRIHMIDEGICPVYYTGREPPFDPSRIPVGLQVHPSAVAYQADSKDQSIIETNTEDWWHAVNHGVEKAVPFTIPPRLTLGESTGIGAFGPSGIMIQDLDAWADSRSLRATSGFQNWRVMMSDFSGIQDSLDLLLYPADEDDLNRPFKVFLEKPGPDGMTNVALDRLILNTMREEIGNFASLGFSDESLSSDNGTEWLTRIHESSLEKLSNHQKMIQLFGPISMIKSSKSVYISIQFPQNGTGQIVVFNGNPNSITMSLGRLIPKKNQERLYTIEGHQWRCMEFPAPDSSESYPFEFQVATDEKMLATIFKGSSDFLAAESDGSAESRINANQSFSMVIWPRMNAPKCEWDDRKCPLPEWMVPEPVLEQTETVIPDVETPLPPPPDGPPASLPPPPDDPPPPVPPAPTESSDNGLPIVEAESDGPPKWKPKSTVVSSGNGFPKASSTQSKKSGNGLPFNEKKSGWRKSDKKKGTVKPKKANKLDFEIHLNLTTKKKTFQCSRCGEHKPDLASIEHHMKHNCFKCEECGGLFKIKREYTQCREKCKKNQGTGKSEKVPTKDMPPTPPKEGIASWMGSKITGKKRVLKSIQIEHLLPQTDKGGITFDSAYAEFTFTIQTPGQKSYVFQITKKLKDILPNSFIIPPPKSIELSAYIDFFKPTVPGYLPVTLDLSYFKSGAQWRCTIEEKPLGKKGFEYTVKERNQQGYKCDFGGWKFIISNIELGVEKYE